jgi:uncharacterized protein
MRNLAENIIRLRHWITITIVILTAFFLYQIRYIHINSDFIKSLPDDDPIAIEYKTLGKKYKGTDMGMIIVQAPDIYTPAIIGDIHQITQTLKGISGVSSVTSLTDIIFIESDSLGIEVGKLIDEYELPQDAESLQLLRSRVGSKDMYMGSIVSKDATATIIMFTLDGDINQQDAVKEIRSTIESLDLTGDILFGGFPVLIDDISNIIIEDITWLVPLVAIILLLVLFVSFRSVRGTLLPVVSVAIASTWTVGLMSLLGYDITMISGNIPVVLFAVGSAYAIHVINHTRMMQDKSSGEVLVTSLGYMILPVFLSSITTVFGFLAFIFGSYLTMIKDFGVFSAVGTFFSFLLAVTFVPVMLSYFPSNEMEKNQQSAKDHKFLEVLVLKPLNGLLFRYSGYILAFWALVLMFGAIASFSIIRNTNISAFFKSDNSTRISEQILQEKFGGSAPVYIRFEADMQDPAVLMAMKGVEDYIRQNPFVSISNSVAGLIEELNDAMGEGRAIPDDRAKIEQLWFLLVGQDIMEQLVSPDLDEGIIQSRFASVNTGDTDDFLDSLDEYIQGIQTDDMRITVNGMPSVYRQIDKSLLRSQLGSLALAGVFVFMLLGLSLKSFKMGFFGIIPLVATVLLLFGFMGVTGIPLDLATVLVASVALGIGVDYSIHVISAFNSHINSTSDVYQAIEKTLYTTGKSIIINILSVAAGFSVLMFSQLVPIQYFGLLVAISMFSSGFGALTLLPVILILHHKYKGIQSVG